MSRWDKRRRWNSSLKVRRIMPGADAIAEESPDIIFDTREAGRNFPKSGMMSLRLLQ